MYPCTACKIVQPKDDYSRKPSNDIHSNKGHKYDNKAEFVPYSKAIIFGSTNFLFTDGRQKVFSNLTHDFTKGPQGYLQVQVGKS